MKPGIAEGDYNRMVSKAESFLSSKKQVRVSVLLRGRQRYTPQIGMELLTKFADDVSEFGTLASRPNEKSMSLVLNPKKGV